MKNYHFDTEIAVLVGVEEAVLYQNILFWCEKNKANDRHFHDGNWWTYNSTKAFSELFPFWHPKKIERLLSKLTEEGLIESGIYNENKYDRTKWYAVVSLSIGQDCPDHSTELSNGVDESGEPIPYINTDSKNTDKKQSLSDYEIFVRHINQKTGKKYRGDDKSKRQFNARVKSGYVIDDLKKAVDSMCEAQYHKENGFQYITPEFATRPDKIEMYLNAGKAEEDNPYKNILGYDPVMHKNPNLRPRLSPNGTAMTYERKW
jgi:uncharacterized phage protein (TIGR02220 family)